MPLYEYKCTQCGKDREVLQSLRDTAPECCDETMQRQISRTNFSLKGGGWYKDHYGLKPSPQDPQD
jgi:putative FmdB family regulatory protein